MNKPVIRILDRSTVLPDGQVPKLRDALQRYVDRYFGPAWRVDANIVLEHEGTAKPSDWELLFIDAPDIADALGFHDLSHTGTPMAKVFCEPTLEAGDTISGVASHEVAEILVDPYCQEYSLGPVQWHKPYGAQQFWATEVCLSGDTLIRLANGRAVTIESLAASGGRFQVFSANKNGNIVAATGKMARKTGTNRDVVAVKTAAGEVVRCTADHRFLMADGSYCEAVNLKPGSQLFSSMLPAFAPSNPVDGTEIDAVFSGHDAGRPFGAANVSYGGFRKNRHSVEFANSAAVSLHSFLSAGVQHVLSVRSKKQVIGIDARRNVAGMADFHPRRYGSLVHFVQKTMHQMYPALVPNLSIAEVGFGRCPDPAPRPLFNARPKALFKRWLAAIVSLKARLRVGGSVASNAAIVEPTHPLGPMGASATFDGTDTCKHVHIVDSVQPAGKCDVFDFEVPVHHNFSLANGIFVHNCDPVQAGSFNVLGMPMSDFVFPAWFSDQTPAGQRVSYLKTVTHPFQLDAGGWAIVCRGDRWKNVYGSKRAERQHHKRQHLRGSYYGDPSPWKKSRAEK